MSRYQVFNPQTEELLIYGFDHALGYWLEIYDKDEETPKIEKSSFFDGLTNGKMLILIEEREFPVPNNHKTLITLDAEF